MKGDVFPPVWWIGRIIDWLFGGFALYSIYRNVSGAIAALLAPNCAKVFGLLHPATVKYRASTLLNVKL